MTWDPGPRPAWVQHAIDGEGGPVYELAAAPLVVDHLLAEARVRAGLDDFGGDDFLEPLGVFVRSVEEEAGLHVVGRWRVREVLLRALENRLRITAYVAEDPGVLDEVIAAPIVVTGSPRAGTSIMHELLALLPGTRAPLAWEYWWPAPPADPDEDEDDDPRIPLANRDVRLSASLAPAFDGMHEQGARVPREDPSAMLISLRSDVLAAHYPTPSYAAWFATCDMAPAYDMHKLVLQILQRRHHDGRTWVIKAPGHLAHLDLVLERYPDARIVVCHRDPLAMISSVTSLTATLRWAHAASVDYRALAAENMATWLSGSEVSAQFSPSSQDTTLFRVSQEPDADHWLGGVSDKGRSEYIGAIRQAQERPQHAQGLRLPGRREYMSALDQAVLDAVEGKKSPEDALAAAAAAWDKITARRGLETQRAALERSLGLRKND